MSRDPKSFNGQLKSSSSWTLLNSQIPRWDDNKALLAAQRVGIKKLARARERKTPQMPQVSEFFE